MLQIGRKCAVFLNWATWSVNERCRNFLYGLYRNIMDWIFRPTRLVAPWRQGDVSDTIFAFGICCNIEIKNITDI